MSLSNPTTENPVKKFIEFKADLGVFRYWDKQKEENIPLEFPIQFIVLDELATISGYCEKTNSGIYSNEIHNLNFQQLNVKSFKGGVHIVGKYADIKDEVKAYGGKFTKSVYAALLNEGGLELVNFRLKGAAFSGWMDSKFNSQRPGVEITKCEDKKKGTNKYKQPVFDMLEITEEYLNEATAMDIKLQEYLTAYESKQIEKPAGDDPEDYIKDDKAEDELKSGTNDDSLPF